MFQDDRMIPVLSAVVLMVTVGMFLQRIDAVDRLLGGAAPPAVAVLHDDEVAVAGNKLLRIDVFANDENVDESARAGLKVVSGPTCGRLFVRSGKLEYVPELGCEGRETIRYSFEGAEPDQVATVVAMIEGVGEDMPTGTKSPPRIAHAVPSEDSVGTAPAGAARAGMRPPVIASTGRPAAPASLPASATASEAPDLAVAELPSSRDRATGPGRQGSAGPRRGSPAAEPSPGPARADPGALARSEPRDLARPAPAAGPAVGGIDLASQAAPLASGREILAEKAARPAVSAPPAVAARTTASTAAGIPPDARRPSPESDLALAAVRPEGAAARRLSTSRPDPVMRETQAGPVRADSPVSEGGAPALAGGAGPPLVVEADDDPATAETVTVGRTASHANRRPAAGPDRGSPEVVLSEAGGERVAALSDPAGHQGAAPGDDAVAARRAEPVLSGTKIAVLVLPWDLDRASSPALVGPGEREGTGRGMPQRPLRGAAPDRRRLLLWRPPAPRPAVFVGRSGPAPAGSDVSPRTAAAGADGPAFVLAVMGHDGAGPASGPDLHGTRSAPEMASGAPEDTGPRLAALSPALSPGLAVGPALDVMPVEPLSLPPGFEGLMVPRPRPADLGRRDPAREPDAPSAEPAVEPLVAEPVAPCTEVPGLTLDIRRAGVTVLGVAAPCQAGTVAELAYSGLRLAVPLDGNGQGSVTVPGFEPISPSVVTFLDGSELQFELPFLDVEQVSRVALAWDAPVELGLNALEHGAEPNSPGHVRPGAARSLQEVRQTGGGYLSVFWPVAGVGQSVQIYSWHHHDGESPGIVRMLVDFVSRDRDRLASACGNGRDAAPTFMVLRSEAGRLLEPEVRRLDAIDCRQVPEAEGASRLISGVVDDLLITR